MIISVVEFMVPQPHDIDISDHVKVPIDPNVCVTPSAQNHRAKKPVSIRRRKSPVALKITKVNMIWSDDEDDDSLSPPATYSNRKFKPRTNLVKRKILEEDLADDLANLNIKDSVSKETNLEDLNEDRNSTQKKSIRDIMIKVTSFVPDISKSLMNLIKTDLPATMDNIDKLIESVENLKIKSKTRKSVKDTKQLTVADYNKNIDQAVELLKDMAIKEKKNENIDSSTLIKPETVDKLQKKTSEIHNEKKFFKTRTLRESIENAGTSLKNESKNAQSKHAKLLLNSENHGTRTTRSSIRKCQKEKPS